MSKCEAAYFVGSNQAINRVRVDSFKMRNRGAFSGSLAAHISTIVPSHSQEVPFKALCRFKDRKKNSAW